MLPFVSLFESQLTEMPVGNFELMGDWSPEAKPRGYDKASIGILTNPLGVEKIKQKWSRIDQTFDLYFLRTPGASKFSETGEVTEGWLKQHLKWTTPIDRDKITVIFVNNRGDEKIPMTAWTLAHRFGHAYSRGTYGKQDNPYWVFSKRLEYWLNEIYRVAYGGKPFTDYMGMGGNFRDREKTFNQTCTNLGTMKSCRDRNLRN